jgi:alkylhydroperoxidase family enzyme
MAWIRTIDEGDADEELAALYARMVDPRIGGVDNIMKIHALHPAGLRGHYELYRAVMRGTEGLPRVDREAIALVVSRINGCHY